MRKYVRGDFDRESRRRIFARSLRVEQLESRVLMNVDWRNPADSLDVNNDLFISPLDVLVVINDLNSRGARALPPTRNPTEPFLDATGNQSVDPLDVLTIINYLNAAENGSHTLTDQGQYSVQQDISITLGQSSGARLYRMEVNADFGVASGTGLVPDLFSVFLVDPADPSHTLLDRGVNGTSLFSLSSRGSEMGLGLARWDGHILEIDLSSIKNQDTGLLRVQLINGDPSSQSNVSVRPLTNAIDSARIAGTLFLTSGPVQVPGPALNLASLTSASTVKAEVENVRFDSALAMFVGEVGIKNLGTAIGRNVALELPGLPAGVTLSNASGISTDGVPYLNLREAIKAGGLGANSQSDRVELRINNPGRQLFTLQPQFLVGTPNLAPTLAPIPTQTVMPGGHLAIQLAATDTDNDLVTYAVREASGNAQLPTGLLQASDGSLVFSPTPNDLGSYQIEVTASDGALSTSRSFTLNVVADPIASTRISGRVLDVDQSPIVGLKVEIGGLQGLTQSDGSFKLDLGSGPVVSDTIKVRGELVGGPVQYPFIAEKLAFVLKHDVFTNVNNVIDRPIYLPKLDVANGKTIDPSKDTTVTTAAIPGAAVFVKAGTLMNQQGTPFTGTLSITNVPMDLTPASLPDALRPGMVVTIQPGDMVFATPAPLTLPNTGYAPGTVLDLWSINPVTGQFDKVGTSQVSADGSVINTISGGIRNSSWHLVAPPPPEPTLQADNPNNARNDCPTCKAVVRGNSEVDLHAGIVTETHDLPSYQSLGQSRGLTLTYDSLRADPQPIIHVGYDNVSAINFQDPDQARLIASLTVSRGSLNVRAAGNSGGANNLVAGDNLWKLPQAQGPIDAALQVDLRSQPTGVYDYSLSSGLYGLVAGTGYVGSSTKSGGQVVSVNSVDSPFGSGWGLNGLQQIVSNPDGSALIVDGGSQTVFQPATPVRQDLFVAGFTVGVLRYHQTTGSSLGVFVPEVPFGSEGLRYTRAAIFGPNGDLYASASDCGGPIVLRYDGKTGGPKGTVVENGSGGIDCVARDIAFGPDGSLYVADGNTDKVLRFNGTTGAFVSVAASGVPQPDSIAFGPDGNLYVSSFTDNNILRFDRQTGALLGTFVPRGSGGLIASTRIAFGPDHNLYVSDEAANHVLRFDGATGQFKDVFASSTIPGQFKGLTFGPDGNLYVGLDSQQSFVYDSILRFDGTTGQFIDTFVAGQPNGLESVQTLTFAPPPPPIDTFVAPPGDFSTLVRLADGTYRRTTKDQTVSVFDSSNRIATVTDRNGNVTRYVYDATTGQLTKIVDPVGLETTFTYTGDKITQITDPANRSTQLAYDLAGNLVQITDPDGSNDSWTYDANHHPIVATDKRGNTGQDFYDFAGRVTGAVLPDGSTMHVKPAETRGLYPAALTSDQARVPLAVGSVDAMVQSADGDGHVQVSKLDAFAQFVSGSDDAGLLPSVARNSQNLVTSQTDARGNVASMTYDAQGNLTSMADSVSGTAKRQFTYDPKYNQVASVTDEIGRQTLYDIDPATGNVRSVTKVVGAVGGADDVVTRKTHTSQGLLATMSDPNGLVTRFDYDPLGRLITLTEAAGTPDQGVTHFEHNAAGNITASIDENGNRTTYQYDAMNRRTRLTEADPDGAGPLTAPVTQRVYDASGNLVSMTDARNRTTLLTYDPLARLTSTTDASGGVNRRSYDPAGNVVSSVDELGRETRYIYDSRNRLVETIDAAGGHAFIRYDADDNPIVTTDENGHATAFAYDARSRVVRVTDALGNATSNEYNAANDLIAVTDRNGHTTHYAYDDLDRRTSVTDALGGVISYAYDQGSNLVAMTDELNRRTQMAYDARNRRTSVTTPLGNVSSVAFDPFGNVITASDGLGQATLYTYDGLNRLSQRTDANGGVRIYAYDPLGNRIGMTDELGRTTQDAYDALDRPISMTDPLGQVTQTSYDAVGNVTSVADGLGQVTSYVYDVLNRPTKVTDARGGVTSSTYDAAGNLLTLADPINNKTTYAYNELNRLTTETNPLGAARIYGYDAVGNLTAQTDRDNRVRRFTYDELNRQTKEEWIDGNGNPVRAFNFAFDAASQLTSAADPASAYAYTYDLDQRLTSVSNAGTSGGPTVAFNYTYDAANNQRARTDTIAGSLRGTNTYSYDLLNRMTRITQSGTGVADNRVDMSYDDASQMTGVARFTDLAGTQGVASSGYGYDSAGRLTGLTHAHGGTTLAQYSWTYDAANRITKATLPDGAVNYAYDTTNQLTSATSSFQPNEAYSYDKNGNRTNAGYLTGTDNRLLSDGTYNYAYDAEGNRISRTNIATGEVTTYQSDYRNRLTQVTTKSSAGAVTMQATYAYDVYDRRIAKTVDADGTGPAAPTVERFVYDGVQIALTFDGAGTQTHRYLYGPAVDLIIADENAAGTVLWPLTDNQGTVRDLVNSAGAVQDHLKYDSFGRITAETNAANDFLFAYTGRELDRETGLDYYRARYYDPVAGRFISQDALPARLSDPSTLNAYTYVRNAPIRATDPTGWEPIVQPFQTAEQVMATLSGYSPLKVFDLLKRDLANQMMRITLSQEAIAEGKQPFWDINSVNKNANQLWKAIKQQIQLIKSLPPEARNVPPLPPAPAAANPPTNCPTQSMSANSSAGSSSTQSMEGAAAEAAAPNATQGMGVALEAAENAPRAAYQGPSFSSFNPSANPPSLLQRLGSRLAPLGPYARRIAPWIGPAVVTYQVAKAAPENRPHVAAAGFGGLALGYGATAAAIGYWGAAAFSGPLGWATLFAIGIGSGYVGGQLGGAAVPVPTGPTTTSEQ